jgi:hypothetical protein
MPFSETWFLLEQEGLLARACLCNGLTALRNANLGDKKGLFYSAFFELSIGFERTMKLILILDHMANNNLIPPDSNTIKSYGHKLILLFDSTKTICVTHGLNSLHDFQADSLPLKILTFLDHFAQTDGRYANINKLTGHRHHAMADPLVQWGKIANLIFQKHATNKQRQRAMLNGQAASAAFGDDVTCLISDLDQQPLDVAGLHTRDSELEVAAMHAIFALVTLISALRDVLGSVCGNAWKANPPGPSGLTDVPDMKEFFQFAWSSRKHVMRKRRWP